MCPVALTDTVTIHYTAKLENGELIDHTEESKPLTLAIGRGTLFPAVEASLFGMEPGQTRVVHIQPEDAYGHHIEELTQHIPLVNFKGKVKPQKGMILSLTLKKDGQDQIIPATVTQVDQDKVTVDYNHPLAGKIIVYTVSLVGINN